MRSLRQPIMSCTLMPTGLSRMAKRSFIISQWFSMNVCTALTSSSGWGGGSVQTDAMYAVAEVYETDVQRVRIGQRATVSSPALAAPLSGTVDRIGLKIGKKDVLSVDPAAKTDARVVEVRILLDDAAAAAGLTNLEVDVAIAP